VAHRCILSVWVRKESGAQSHVVPRRHQCQSTGVTNRNRIKPGFLRQQSSSLACLGYVFRCSAHLSEVSATYSSGSRDDPPSAPQCGERLAAKARGSYLTSPPFAPSPGTSASLPEQSGLGQRRGASYFDSGGVTATAPVFLGLIGLRGSLTPPGCPRRLGPDGRRRCSIPGTRRAQRGPLSRNVGLNFALTWLLIKTVTLFNLRNDTKRPSTKRECGTRGVLSSRVGPTGTNGQEAS